jgi:hypothetical protein
VASLYAREGIELADALLKIPDVTYPQLETEEYTRSFAEAMATRAYQ